MKLQVISDLHLEFYKRMPPIPILADILVLAGDIGIVGSALWREFMTWCAANYKKVIYVAGNHEFYGGNYEKVLKELGELKDPIIFLHNTAVDIDGLRFLGTTLWTDVPREEEYAVQEMMSDYKKIRRGEGYRRLNVGDTNGFHAEARNWLKAELDKCRVAHQRALVITHHLPSFEMVAEKYRACNNYGFASSCDDIIDGAVVDAWICGHSHVQIEKKINGVPVIMAPIGYPNEIMRAPPSLCVIDIGENGVAVEWIGAGPVNEAGRFYRSAGGL